MTTTYEEFSGAKIALIEGTRVVTYLRDNKPEIPFPGLWDLAGGGQENSETPEQCALRETKEEFGLDIDASRVVWRERCQAFTDTTKHSYFLVAHITPTEIATICFGDEGQYWQMMEIEAFLSHPKAIPQLQERLARFLSSQNC
ncbi:nucleoside triphosphate pyrophosphohydrolase [Falsiruegeria litorea R37]|uniref:Nucleoside triphosphate pyrophosphohydrolase n=1 Tax=Falsiruegeria litorea R37 TaxID=1200284 RepID=A0A1Y5RXJ0_9RHOB|nr:NUDIX hydrolase [Falsiruegeria litorea]SLN27286.1 nucleoside triphosphate pyrophosphohydrolase [Falsiruegeria litorea R37]